MKKFSFGVIFTGTGMHFFSAIANGQQDYKRQFLTVNGISPDMPMIIGPYCEYTKEEMMDYFAQSEQFASHSYETAPPPPQQQPLELKLAPEKPMPTRKDTMMARIIEANDIEMFYEFEAIFSPEERLLIKEKLRIV